MTRTDKAREKEKWKRMVAGDVIKGDERETNRRKGRYSERKADKEIDRER